MADWESIVRENGRMAFDTAWRILGHVADTEDVVQEALLEAFRLQQTQSVCNWGGLLRRLATNRALDRLRSRRQAEPWQREPDAPKREHPESVAIERELAKRLRAAVARLPAREAEVFCLRCFGDMPNAEIAATLGMSSDAVAVALHKARSKLKELLAMNHDQPVRKSHERQDDTFR